MKNSVLKPKFPKENLDQRILSNSRKMQSHWGLWLLWWTIKEKDSLSTWELHLPRPLPEPQSSAYSASGLCQPLLPLEDFFAFRKSSGNCHRHCAHWQMSPKREWHVPHTTSHFWAQMENGEEKWGKGVTEKLIQSRSKIDGVPGARGWDQGDGMGLQLGQEFRESQPLTSCCLPLSVLLGWPWGSRSFSMIMGLNP